MKDREMGDHFHICVLFQAITVLYSASISHPLGRPPNISHPSRRPSNISHPSWGPSNISHPSRRTPSISHPSEIPPNISHPLGRPPNISHPSEIPPNISHPLGRPPNIPHPLGRPPNISHPSRRPPNISHPSRRPPNHQLLEDSMKLFNEGLNNSSFLYKLLEVNSHRQADSHENNSLSFVIKETVCRKSEEIPGECPFKEGGVMKNCTAVYSGPGQDKAELRCQTLDPPVSGLPPATSEGGDGKKSSRGHRKFINSGKKNEEAFHDVIDSDIIYNNIAGSCLECIFHDLPNSQNTIRSSVSSVLLLYILLQSVM